MIHDEYQTINGEMCRLASNGFIYVSNTGKTYRKKKRGFVVARQNYTSRGRRYAVTTYCVNGIQTPCYVHRLVAEAFVENPGNYQQVNHKDGNPKNNDASNLEWCSGSQNIQHGYDHGLIPNLKNNGKACTNCGVLRMRLNADGICKKCELKKYFEFKKSSERTRLLSNIDIKGLDRVRLEVAVFYATGMPISEIAEKYGVSKQCIHQKIQSIFAVKEA